jgi:D-lactate dehydrogenase
MTSHEAFLQSISIFRSLPQESLAQIAAAIEERHYRQGDVLCREGESDPWLYFIVNGFCSAQKKHGSDTIELRKIGPREVMGLTSAFRSKARSATLVAASDLEVLALSHDRFKDILFRGPHHTEAVSCLLEYFAASVRRKNKEMALLLKDRRTSTLPKIAVFDSKEFTRTTFLEKAKDSYDFLFFDTRLQPNTAALAEGARSVVGFVNDDIGADTLVALANVGVEHVALRCAGFNNVDLAKAKELGISVTRVPAYSPHAVAEHSLALILALNRKIHRAYQRVREGNFTLDGLVGFDLFGKTVGVVGTGKIGRCMVHILRGLGCRVLCFDHVIDPLIENLEGVEYCSMDRLLRESKIISLYVPLTKDTFHMIDKVAIQKMQDGVMLINTSRGGLIETKALIDGLKSGKITSAGLDVYEEESAYFFEDFSGKSIDDDVLARLLTFNNVIVTSHQAFLTSDALANIASTTLQSIDEFVAGRRGAALTHHVAVQS